MKAILEYSLPDDEWAFRVAVESSEVMSGLLDLRNRVRSRLKHGPEPDTAFVEEIHQQIEELL